jgi:hypothetical protein
MARTTGFETRGQLRVLEKLRRRGPPYIIMG